jgi:hypothetical protein
MRTAFLLWPCLLGVAALPACSGADSGANSGATNPATLWLAPMGSETRVQLVATQPPPY